MKTVTINPGNVSFQVDEEETILSAALKNGLVVPYGCKDGACGSCKAKITAGEIDQEAGLTKPARPAVAEHQRKSNCPEHHRGQAEVGQILDRDVDAVLAAREPAFQEQEAGLHLKCQESTEDDPQEIQIFR